MGEDGCREYYFPYCNIAGHLIHALIRLLPGMGAEAGTWASTRGCNWCPEMALEPAESPCLGFRSVTLGFLLTLAPVCCSDWTTVNSSRSKVCLVAHEPTVQMSSGSGGGREAWGKSLVGPKVTCEAVRARAPAWRCCCFCSGWGEGQGTCVWAQAHHRRSEWHQGGWPQDTGFLARVYSGPTGPLHTEGWGCQRCEPWALAQDGTARSPRGLQSPGAASVQRALPSVGGSPTGSPMLFHRLDFCTHNVLPCLLLSRTWEVSGRPQAPEHHCDPICRALVGRVTWKLSNNTDPHRAWGRSRRQTFHVHPQDYLLGLFWPPGHSPGAGGVLSTPFSWLLGTCSGIHPCLALGSASDGLDFPLGQMISTTDPAWAWLIPTWRSHAFRRMDFTDEGTICFLLGQQKDVSDTLPSKDKLDFSR